MSKLDFAPWSEAVSVNPHGISVATTTFFLIGEMAGAGIVAMPGAMRNAYWYGVILLAIGALASGYTGCQLGWSWAMLQEMWPRYKDQVRKPYPEIGKQAMGGKGIGSTAMKNFVSACIVITLFCAATLFSILAASEVDTVISTYTTDSLGVGVLIVIVVAVLWPLTMLGTPADFWWVSLLAMASSVTACILIIAGSLIDVKDPPFFLFSTTTTVMPNTTTGVTLLLDEAAKGLSGLANATITSTTAVSTTAKEEITYSQPIFRNFVDAYAAITFAYGGHSAFPTMQHDMKQPSLFWKSVLYGYFIICLLYFPTAIIAYACYGDLLSGPYNGNISALIQTPWIRVAISILIGAHVCFAFLISINPVNQEVEEFLGLPTNFTWKRLVSRTVVIWLVCFLAESIPLFGPLLDFIGATTITMLTFVLPPLFYLLLKHRRRMMALEKIPSQDKPYAITIGYHVFEDSMSAHRSITNGSYDYYKAPVVIPPRVQWWEWLINGLIIIVGILAGAGGTYGAIETFINGYKFQKPCYLQKC